MDAKPWWTSRTVWTAIAAIGLGAIGAIANIITGVAPLGVDQQTAIAAVIGGGLALFFRWITKQPITLMSTPKGDGQAR